jgi:hypothetical protein
MKFTELRREAYEANMEIEKQKLAIYLRKRQRL